MITYTELLDAVNTINGSRYYFENTGWVRQLIRVLRVYSARDEFDGTIKSAYDCLKQSEYEFDFIIGSEK